MSSHETYEIHHDQRDPKPGRIFGITIGLFLVVLVIFSGAYFLYRGVFTWEANRTMDAPVTATLRQVRAYEESKLERIDQVIDQVVADYQSATTESPVTEDTAEVSP